MDSTCIVRGVSVKEKVRVMCCYLLELHGSDVAVAVLELHQEGEPEAGGALVHVERDVLAPVPARRPAMQPTKQTPPVTAVSTRGSCNTFPFSRVKIHHRADAGYPERTQDTTSGGRRCSL